MEKATAFLQSVSLSFSIKKYSVVKDTKAINALITFVAFVDLQLRLGGVLRAFVTFKLPRSFGVGALRVVKRYFFP